MKIPGELLKIDNQSVPSLKSYSVRYEKIWRDSRRNMAGDFRATTLGRDITISAEFGGQLLQEHMTSLLPKLAADSFSVTFYDPSTDSTRTATYFVDGYDVELLSKHRGQFQPISVTFNPISRVA